MIRAVICWQSVKITVFLKLHIVKLCVCVCVCMYAHACMCARIVAYISKLYKRQFMVKKMIVGIFYFSVDF